jgi:hypothetical protein
MDSLDRGRAGNRPDLARARCGVDGTPQRELLMPGAAIAGGAGSPFRTLKRREKRGAGGACWGVAAPTRPCWPAAGSRLNGPFQGVATGTADEQADDRTGRWREGCGAKVR